jgi:MtfA peptidase
VLNRWWSTLRKLRDERTLRRRAIPDTLWQLTLARYPFLARRDAADQAALRDLSTLFLAHKEFTGAQGLEITDEIAVAVAAQACLPVLRLGLDAYAGFVGIVIHPDEVVAKREVMDEDGVVHRYDETLSGEAMEGGPVMLSWRDVEEAGESAEWGYNVVVHEFAHVLDMADGEADGVPVLPDRAAREAWRRVLGEEFHDFCDRVDAGEDTLLDPYGAESVDEFFAVASEVFFVAPDELRLAHPQLYELLAGYYRQDPAAGAQ